MNPPTSFSPFARGALVAFLALCPLAASAGEATPPVKEQYGCHYKCLIHVKIWLTAPCVGLCFVYFHTDRHVK